MSFLVASLSLYLAGGCASLASGRGRRASRIGGLSAIVASLLGLVPACLMCAETFRHMPTPLSHTLCKLPMGYFALSLDVLSAAFLVPVLIIVAVAALYGIENGDGSDTGHAGAHWFFYNLLAGGMVLTLTAADAFLFLLAWEIMSLAPFFLITLNDASAETRAAAWIYLVAAHLGVLFLLAFFALLAAINGGALSFSVFAATAATLDPVLPGGMGLLFILALIGFAAKAGCMPLHVWLPEAHPAAPSHVSAVMSGAMITMGIYGLLRTFTFLGPGEGWWAYTLIGIGVFSGATGILQALAQGSIKRSLAFSSVENMGIICLGLGVALLSLQNDHPAAAALAATGSLLHLINHALSKGLLFLCAGSVLHGTGTVTLRLLGGLQKRMPVVGWCFLLGSAAIAALPPLNGFAGELFIYLGIMFGGTAFVHSAPEHGLILWFVIFCLAGIGGFTLLCFTRLYGIAFLGSPRSEWPHKAHTASLHELIAICLLAGLCVVSAANAPRIARVCHLAVTPGFLTTHNASPALIAAPPHQVLSSVSTALTSTSSPLMPPRLAGETNRQNSAIALLQNVNAIFLILILGALAAFLFRRRLMRSRQQGVSPTWDCGYLAPTPRIQYTAGSFSQPAALFMRTLLRQKLISPEITEYFPVKAKASLVTRDWLETGFFVPLFGLVARVAAMCKELQHGRANGYILYILITLVGLMAWKL